MLKRLRIENLAVVEDVSLDFRPGLNVITGSTGAGKSLIVGAVNLLLGEKGNAAAIREGHDEAFVSATFSVPGATSPALAPWRTPAGEIETGRRVTRAGRSSATINGRSVTLRELRAVTSELIEPHGQNEQYRLRDPASHIEYVDGFARTDAARDAFSLALSQWRRATAELDRFDAETARIRERSELFAHRLQEIDRIAPRPGEKADLESSARLMANAEKMFSALEEACMALHESDESLVSSLGHVMRRLAPLASIEPRIAAIQDALAQAESLLSDAAEQARTLRGGMEFEPADVERTQERLDVLVRLEQRYRMSIEQILTDCETWKRELDALADAGNNREVLEKELATAANEVAKTGTTLSALRRRAAVEFDARVNEGLAHLMMKGARFRTDIAHAPDDTGSVRVDGRGVQVFENGLDEVRMHVRTNPGEAEGPLETVASTGELSRIALILKPLAGGSGGTIIFDEIDAGVGADMGEVLAEKLLALAAVHQIVCITHLPQIAARGSHHLVVAKETVKERTRVRVHTAVDGERTREIARMLGGEDGSDRRTALARELLSAPSRPRTTRVRP